MTKNDLQIAFSTEFLGNPIDGGIIITGISPTFFDGVDELTVKCTLILIHTADRTN